MKGYVEIYITRVLFYFSIWRLGGEKVAIFLTGEKYQECQEMWGEGRDFKIVGKIG